MNSRNRSTLAALLVAFALGASAREAVAQGAPKAAEISRILSTYCLACHDWAAAPAKAVAAGVLVPGKADQSPAIGAMESGSMPPQGEGPTAGEAALIRAWVAAGAPLVEPQVAAPGQAAPADAVTGATAQPPDAVSGATGAGAGASAQKPFLGFRSKTAFHRAAGWGSAGLLLAAGVVGAIRAYDLIVPAHEYRDSLGLGEEDGTSPACQAKIEALWNANQGLRWAHVGLLAAGETLYLSNAITGISWIRPGRPAPASSKLHRWAFYAHAGLMAAEVVLGLVSTDALSRGDHELVSSLGVAHAAIGIAIPLVIGAAGLVEREPPPLPPPK